MEAPKGFSYESLQLLYRSMEFGFGIPVILMDIFIVFIIWKHTPSDMTTYSKLLLNQVAWEFITVVFTCILFQPVMLFPYAVVVINGPLSWFGRNGAIFAVTASIQLYGQCMVNLTACIVYRYYKLGKKSRTISTMMGMLLGLWYLTNTLVAITSVLSQLKSDEFLHNQSCTLFTVIRPDWSIVQSERFLFFRLDLFTYICWSTALALTGCNVLFDFVLFFLIRRRLQEKKITMSSKVFHLQRSMVLGLLIQALSPTLCILIPFTLMLFLTVFQLGNEVTSALTFNSLIYYHFLGGAALLYFVRPYRRGVIGYFRTRKKVEGANFKQAVTKLERAMQLAHQNRVSQMSQIVP